MDSQLLNIVSDFIKLGWPPQQISGRLRDIFPDRAEMHVSHETIYTALYAMPRGELGKELIRTALGSEAATEISMDLFVSTCQKALTYQYTRRSILMRLLTA